MACTSGSAVLDPGSSSGPQHGGKKYESVEKEAVRPPAAASKQNSGGGGSSSSSSSMGVWGLRSRSLSLTGEGLKAIRWLGRRLSLGKNASSLSNGDELSRKSTAREKQSSPPAAGGAAEQTKLISPMPLAAMGSVRSNPLIGSTVRRSSIPIRFYSAQNMVMPTLEEGENPLEKSADGDEMQQELRRSVTAPKRSFVHKQAVNFTAPIADNKRHVFRSGEVYQVLSTATKRVSWASTSDKPAAKWPDLWMCIENSYAYAKIGREVGPLGIRSVHMFCEELAGLLTARPTAGRHIVVFTGNTTAKRTNLAFLLGCFLIAREGYSAERAWAVFDNVKPSPFCTYTDVSGGAGSALQLSLYECMQGFSQAFTQGMYDATIFSAQEHSFDQALVGGVLLKVVQGKFVIFFPDSTSEIPADAYVKTFEANGVSCVLRLVSKEGGGHLDGCDPEVFRAMGIDLPHASNGARRKNDEDAGPDPEVFRAVGIEHHNLELDMMLLPDVEDECSRTRKPRPYEEAGAADGPSTTPSSIPSRTPEATPEKARTRSGEVMELDEACPTDDTVRGWFRVCDQEMRRGMVAVQCDEGVSCCCEVLIALWLIKDRRFTARQAIAYMRIFRQGSIVGRQQMYLCAVEKSMHDWGDAGSKGGWGGTQGLEESLRRLAREEESKNKAKDLLRQMTYKSPIFRKSWHGKTGHGKSEKNLIVPPSSP